MKARKSRKHTMVSEKDSHAIFQIIDETARRQLGISGQKAVELLQGGQARDNFAWQNIAFLVALQSVLKGSKR